MSKLRPHVITHRLVMARTARSSSRSMDRTPMSCGSQMGVRRSWPCFNTLHPRGVLYACLFSSWRCSVCRCQRRENNRLRRLSNRILRAPMHFSISGTNGGLLPHEGSRNGRKPTHVPPTRTEHCCCNLPPHCTRDNRRRQRWAWRRCWALCRCWMTMFDCSRLMRDTEKGFLVVRCGI